MKIRNNVFDWILDGITAAICVISAAILAVRWNRLPNQVPNHYRMDGTVDGYAGKGMLIVLMVVICISAVLLTVLLRFPKFWNLPCEVTEQNSFVVYRITKYWLSIIRVILIISLSSLVLFPAFSKPLPSWYTWAEVGIITVVIVAGLVVTNVKAKQYH